MIRELRHREVKELAQGLIATEWQSQAMNLGCPAPNLWFVDYSFFPIRLMKKFSVTEQNRAALVQAEMVKPSLPSTSCSPGSPVWKARI